MIIFEQDNHDASVESFKKNAWHKLVNEFEDIIAYIWCGENHFCCFFLNAEGPLIYNLNKKSNWFDSHSNHKLYVLESISLEFFN